MKFNRIQLTSHGLREGKLHEWVIRFVFGGLVSLLAGWLGGKYGPAVGGLFLAFPSILPAIMTFVKRHKGRKEAAEDAWGAALGSLALVGFAFTVYILAESLGAVWALAIATVVWLVLSFLLWLGLA